MIPYSGSVCIKLMVWESTGLRCSNFLLLFARLLSIPLVNPDFCDRTSYTISVYGAERAMSR